MRDVLSNELPPPVTDAALPLVDKAIVELQSTSRRPDSGSSSDAGHRELTLKYLEAILEGNRTAAESLILEMLEKGGTIAEVYEKVLSPAQTRLGRMWHRGEINVADEHFGSATTQSIISMLRPRIPKKRPNGHTVVATATPGDLHEIGLRMVADLFEIEGWNVVYLGANTPTTDLIELLDRRKPDLLALSVTTGLTLRDAGELVERVRETSSLAELKVLVGGPPFNIDADLWRKLGADGCATSSAEAVKLGNQLVAS